MSNADKSTAVVLDAEQKYCGMPFWSWNGDLEPAELRRQVRIMHEMKMNGFFMHSRVGLATEYMSEKWMQCIEESIDEAEKLGMSAALYDEDRWPSGFGGGSVTADERYRMRYLHYEFVPAGGEPLMDGQTVAYYRAERSGDDVTDYELLPDSTDEVDNTIERLRFYFSIAPALSAYNNSGYVNTLNPDAIEQFIKSTHEVYCRRFGEKFGGSIPFIFTDEPNYMNYADLDRRPWTEEIIPLYLERYGESLLQTLPELFFSCTKEFSTTRYRFYRLVTELFVNSFARQIGQWCEKHHLQFTGHLLYEDLPSTQTAYVGAAMPFYAQMQAPGIDMLTQYSMNYEVPLKAFSVAHQFGREWVLSELYGCTGWDFPLHGHKMIGDWQYALGINLRCHHLYWYTMSGQAKRDYPASIGSQSPWYKVYGQVEEYFARLGKAFADAPAVVPLLVLYPQESSWGRAGYCSKRLEISPELDWHISRLTHKLVTNHLLFDFGDESIIEQYGGTGGGVLQINQARYEMVLLPEMDTIRSATVNLLAQFRAYGGKVYTLGGAPQYCDGVSVTDNTLKSLWSCFEQVTMDELAEKLAPSVRRFSLTDAHDNQCQSILSRVGYDANNDTWILFAVNTGVIPEVKTWLHGGVNGDLLAVENAALTMKAHPDMVLEEIDLSDGTARKVSKVKFENNVYYWQADFAPLQSRMYRLLPQDKSTALPEKERSEYTTVNLELKSVRRSEDNFLVLDHADYIVDGELAGENKYILHIDDELRQRLNEPIRMGNMAQPWVTAHEKSGKALDLRLRFAFECDTIPPELTLIMEQMEFYHIKLNNIEQENCDCGFWADQALRKTRLNCRDLLIGKNILEITCYFVPETIGLEAIYLAGDFGVKTPAVIAAAAKDDELIPYYPGNLIYEYTFSLDKKGFAEITLPPWDGAAVSCSLDGQAERLFLSPPWQMTWQDDLAAGEHKIVLTLYGSLRNLMGPFYQSSKTDKDGPNEFKRYDKNSKNLVSSGWRGMASVQVSYCR